MLSWITQPFKVSCEELWKKDNSGVSYLISFFLSAILYGRHILAMFEHGNEVYKMCQKKTYQQCNDASAAFWKSLFFPQEKDSSKKVQNLQRCCASYQDYCVGLRFHCDLEMDFFLLCFSTVLFTVEQCSYVIKVNADQPCQLLMQKNRCLFLEYWFSSLSLSDYRSSRLMAVFTSALLPSQASDIWILLYYECEETNSSIFVW